MRSKSILGTLLVTSALGLSLAGCREDDRRLAAADTSWPATLSAPYPGPLEDRYGPPPQRIPVGRLASYDDGWAWAERSYALDRAFYDTPPDYGFYYDDYEPWVWQTDDRWAMYGDPYADDDWRYYYYQPGAVRPYFIRDDHYGYGFDEAGQLVAMFDLLGRLLSQQDLYRYEDDASRYYQRAYLIRQASLRAQPVVVTREVWLQEAPIIQRTTNVWINAAQQQPDWIRYRERTDERFVRAFDDERRRRAATLTTASVSPDREQRRGFFGRPAGEPRQQLARAESDRRAVSDRRGVVAAPREDRADVRQPRGRQASEQRAFEQDRRQPQVRPEERRAEDRGRKQRQVQQDQQRQAQARRQQYEQQRAAAQSRKEQQDNQRQAEAQARQQQHERQRQAEAQSRKQEQDRQRQAQAQARQQQHEQQRQAEAQSRKQEQDRQRQAQAQARQQQHDQQRQAEAQARQQQEAQKQQAGKPRGQKQEAQAADPASGQGKGGGHGRKG